VLVAMARRRGEVVSREDLVRECWDGRVVGDDAITRCVASVRRLSETHGGFEVATIARVGYRLTETGDAIAPVALPAGEPPPMSPVAVAGRHRLSQAVIFVSAVMVLIAFAAWFVTPDPVSDRSIAVLPFENRSEARENAYLALGIQDEILTLLTRANELRVVSRSATQRFADSPAPARQIGRELGVAYVLDGNVQRAGDVVRVQVALVDAMDERQVWAASYERNADEVFAIESEVAQSVASALQARLTAEERDVIAQPPSANPAAYDAYMRARAFAERVTRTEAEILAAIAAYEEAVRLDPDFAVAWAQLSRRHANYFSLGYDRTSERRDAAIRALDNATRLRPDLAEIQQARGYFLFVVEADLVGAERTFRELEARYPSSADPNAGLAQILGELGQIDRATDYVRRLLALDSLNPYRHAINCIDLMTWREFDFAMQICDRALELLPGDVGILAIKAMLHQARGEWAQARELLRPLAPAPEDWRSLRVMSRQFLFDREPDAAVALLEKYLINAEALGSRRGVVRRWLGDAQRLAGMADSARETYVAARAELESERARQPENPLFLAELAIVHAWLNERDAAMELAQTCERVAEQTRRTAYIADCKHAQIQIALATDEVESLDVMLSDALQRRGASPPLTPALLEVDPEFDRLREGGRLSAFY
jgi:TolB-like protein/Tfp pilus assembly protein PilF